MAANLKNRLARLRALGLIKAAEMQKSASDSPLRAEASRRCFADTARARSAFLDSWERVADMVWTRRLRFTDHLPDFLDPAPFFPLAAGQGRMSGRTHFATKLDGEIVSATRLRFFDLETTGLSGGTGTVAFLAALGGRDEEGFWLRQFFLEDYPGERSFLESILTEMMGDSILVTYNGRAFDLPLLRTRCVMNGLPPPEPPHIDVLFAARRLWKRVHGGAALSLLEREVLGIERAEDVPGSLIPDIWFTYLKNGQHPLMRVVMSHNAEDVASLARLLAKTAGVFAEPRAYSSGAPRTGGAVDLLGLGRTLLALNRSAEGEELLEAALGEGDETAGLLLSRRYFRAKRIEDRRRILGLLPLDLRSCVERAKFCEHSDGNYRAALAWTKRAAALAGSEEEKEALAKRRSRLEKKIKAH